MINVFVYVDALPRESISAQNTPFMMKLTDEGDNYVLRNIMGYSFAIQSTMLSGKLPSETKHWMPYVYAPNSSQHTAKALAPLARKLSFETKTPNIVKLIRYGISSKFFLRKRAKVNCIPWSIADRFYIYPYYYMNELPHFRQLKLELYEKHKVKLVYFGAPSHKERVTEHVIRFFDHQTRGELDLSEDDLFLVVYLDCLDHIGHRYGVQSPTWKATLAKVDKDLKKLYEFLSEKVENFNLALFSDHGMCNIKHTIDALKLLRIAKLNWNHMTAFVDATIMSIWVEEENRKQAVLKAFEKIDSNKILVLDNQGDADTLRENGVLFEDRRYGDLIVQTKPCCMFFPNFYSDLKPFTGVHGFYPNESYQQSFLNLNLNSGKRMSFKPYHIKDIHNLILSLASSN